MNRQSTGLAPGDCLADEEFTSRVSRTAVHLAMIYNWQIDVQEIEQEMWLHLLEAADTDLLTRTSSEIINYMAWRARDWVRRQMCPLRHNTPEGGRWNPMVEFDDDGWEYLADTLAADDDPYAEVDYRLTFAKTWKPAIDTMLDRIAGSKAAAVAEQLMAGHSKAETARRLGQSAAAITYSVKKMKVTLDEIMLSQAGAC